jgi:hypothetical protein
LACLLRGRIIDQQSEVGQCQRTRTLRLSFPAPRLALQFQQFQFRPRGSLEFSQYRLRSLLRFQAIDNPLLVCEPLSQLAKPEAVLPFGGDDELAHGASLSTSGAWRA